jgi:hypothetical protein
MKILYIITGNWGLDIAHVSNIETLRNLNLSNNFIVAAISCNDDFHNYEHIIDFKYKLIVNNTKILSRLTKFIFKYKNQFEYDWFIRIRPEVELLESLDFSKMCQQSINARARVYKEKKKLNLAYQLME